MTRPTRPRRPRALRVRVDAEHPKGQLTDEEQLDRVSRALALVRGERRASPGTRLDAVRWLLNKGWGAPGEPNGDPADRADE